MGQTWKRDGDEELRAIKWDRFWEGVWIYGAAIGLLVLVSMSSFSMVGEVSVALR